MNDHEVVLMAMRRDQVAAALQMCTEWKEIADAEDDCAIEHDEVIEILEKSARAPMAEEY